MQTMTLAELIKALYTDQIQELENGMYELLSRLDINYMNGEQLKALARLVGQNITSLDATTMRTLIHAKIAENASTGTFEDLYNVFYLMTQATDTTLIRVKELFPATVEFETSGTIPAGLEQLTLDALQRTAPAGVKVKSIRKTYNENGWFRFGSTTYTDSGFNAGKLGDSIIK